MRRLSWAVLLLGVEVARAQVGTHVLQRLFLPVMSYRLASTATLLEDDLDRMLDPSLAGTVKGARVYTSLSDLFQGEQLFGNVSFHAYTLAGIGGQVMGVTPLGLVDKYKDRTPLPTSRPGVNGAYLLDSLHYFSTQGPGFPPDRRERIRQEETSEQWTEHRLLLAGVAQPRWGVDVMMGTFRVEQRPFGTEVLPLGNVDVLHELAEQPSGQLLYRRTLQGERSRLQAQDLWAVAAGFLPVVGMPLRITVGLARWTDQVRDTSHYTGLEDRAPGGTLNQIVREGSQEQRMRWPEGVWFGEFRYDLRWTGQAEGVLRAGVYRWSAGLQEGRTVLDTLWDARELLVDTAINRLAFRAETTFAGDRTRLGGYVTWVQQYRYTRARFALGASFWGDRREQALQETYTEQTVERVTNGDGVPNDPNDFTRTTTYTEERTRRTLDQRWGLDLPVAVEFQPLEKAPLWLRLGAWYTLTWQDQTLDDEGRTNTPRTVQTITDAGDTLLTRTPVDLKSVRTRQQSISSSLQFVYGATVPIGDHLRLEIMQFARLTDLTGWRVSVVWKP